MVKDRYLAKIARISVNHKINIIFILGLITPLFPQSNLSFSLGSEYYVSQPGYDDASGISLDYRQRLNSNSEVGLKFNYSMMTYNIDGPSVTNSVNVSVYDVFLVYGYNPGYSFLTMDLKPLIGAGFKILNRAAMKVDLGALGEETVASMSQTYFALLGGLLLVKKISGNLSFFIEPGIAFYDLKAFNRSFSIKGGINVQFN